MVKKIVVVSAVLLGLAAAVIGVVVYFKSGDNWFVCCPKGTKPGDRTTIKVKGKEKDVSVCSCVSEKLVPSINKDGSSKCSSEGYRSKDDCSKALNAGKW